MARFKPFAATNNRNFTATTHVFDTYRELVRKMGFLEDESYDGEVFVTRSRRGEWGEWFEVWENGKIIRQGWM